MPQQSLKASLERENWSEVIYLLARTSLPLTNPASTNEAKYLESNKKLLKMQKSNNAKKQNMTDSMCVWGDQLIETNPEITEINRKEV